MVMYWLTNSFTWLLIFSATWRRAILRKQTIKKMPNTVTKMITKMIQVDKVLLDEGFRPVHSSGCSFRLEQMS